MPRIPESEIERLKREISLAALCAKRGIELAPHGKDLVGRCPFHDDKTPSFIVTPSKNLWHCMGACQKGGSVIDFVMRMDKASFRHAVEILQREIGATPAAAVLKTKMGGEHPILVEPGTELSDTQLLEHVVDFYHRTFMNDPKAMQYLQGRNCFHPEAATRFRIGYANRTLGYRLPDTVEAGKRLKARLQKLGILRESGHEHLSGSVVFPICNEHGQAAQAYGRKITAGLREGTPLHLYLRGEHRGVWNGEALIHQSEWILCEAILDALTLWCHGFRNVTASYGVNGWTPDHLALVRKVGPQKIFIAYDNDDAGNVAANALASLLAAEGVTTYRVAVAKGKDINGFVCGLKEERPEEALRSLLAAAPLMLPAENVPQKIEVSHAECAEAAEKTSDAQPPNPLRSLCEPSSVNSDEVALTLGDPAGGGAGRSWRVRGLAKNLSFELLKVNARVATATAFHVDVLDLYSSKARDGFCARANEVTGIDAKTLAVDLSHVLLACEKRQSELIESRLSGMASKTEETPKMTAEEEREALDMLKSPRLLDIILHDFAACGHVGEETNKLIGYLACISRKLDDPLSVLLMSRSAAGKSSLMQALLMFVPGEDKEEFTAITGQALFYVGENDLVHKVLAIAEDQGATSADYSLKTFQSDKQLLIASTGKDPKTGQLKTERRKVNGPVSILTGTTATEVNYELVNRFLVLTVDEGKNQTRAIHQAQREAETLDGLLKRREREHLIRKHQNAQRLIKPLAVVNPHAPRLKFEDGQLRARRDHKKYLGLIRAIALLHQHQRPIKSAEHRGQVLQFIEVEAADIERADALMREILAHTTDERCPQARALLETLGRFTRQRAESEKLPWGKIWWTCRALREATGWSNRQLRAALGQLIELEYVEQRGGGMGRLASYRLCDSPYGETFPHLFTAFPPPFQSERKGATPSILAAKLAAKAAQKETFPQNGEAHNGQDVAAVAS